MNKGTFLVGKNQEGALVVGGEAGAACERRPSFVLPTTTDADTDTAGRQFEENGSDISVLWKESALSMEVVV